VSADQRDPERFPRSLAYQAQPDLVKVSAAALALSYCHVHTFEHVPDGCLRNPMAYLSTFTRRQAEEAGWHLFEKTMIPAMVGGPRFTPLPPGLEFRDDGGLRMHLANDCLAESVKRTTRCLDQPWDAFRELDRAGIDISPPPAAWLAPDDLDDVAWLEDAVLRLACGQHPGEAARQAHDKHLGRPRRKRLPADPDWLRGQVERTLTLVWFALLHARLGEGRGQLWLAGPLVDQLGEDRRPTWSYPTTEGR
jgi:hypothetical protein